MLKENMVPVVEKAIGGDNAAFETLFNAYWSMAYFYCLKYLKNESEAEDAAQEAFFTLFKNIGNLNKSKLFVAYFSRILTNTCHNHSKSRKNKADTMTFLDDSLIETLSEERTEFLPEVFMAQHELRDEIMQVINELPKKQREVMLLHFLNELSQSEIAAVLDVKPTVVGNRLFHAKAALKQKLKKLGITNSEYTAGLPVVVITQILTENATLITSPNIQARAWDGLQNRISKYNAGEIPENSSISSTAINAGLIVAVCCVGICFAVLGINYYNSTRIVESNVGPVVIETQEVTYYEDRFDIIQALRAVTTLDGFNSFVTRHNFNLGQVITWHDQSGGVQYRLYQRTLYDMTIFTGIRSDSGGVLIVYEIAPAGTEPPQDVAYWINENKS